ncbi:hypothetical protein [Streptomyces sp. NPDC055085]
MPVAQELKGAELDGSGFSPLLKLLADNNAIKRHLQGANLLDAEWPQFERLVVQEIGNTSEYLDADYGFQALTKLLNEKSDFPEDKQVELRNILRLWYAKPTTEKTEPSATDATSQQQATATKIIVCRPHELYKKTELETLAAWNEKAKHLEDAYWARWDPTARTLTFMKTDSKAPPDADAAGWTAVTPSPLSPPLEASVGSMGPAYPEWEYRYTDTGEGTGEEKETAEYRWKEGGKDDWIDVHPGTAISAMDPNSLRKDLERAVNGSGQG